MAYNTLMKMSFTDTSTGLYYTATQDNRGVWTVTTGSAIAYINNLPMGWQDVKINWERDMTYWGVFRSKTDASLSYAYDARAILNYVRSLHGIQSDVTLIIWLLDVTDGSYNIAYKSQFDFKTYKDSVQNEMLDISTLDSELFRLLQAYGDTEFNIPFWTAFDGGWIVNHDAHVCVDEGVKLLYQANYSSSATPSNPLTFQNSDNTLLGGFNHGSHGSAPNDGYHTVISLSQYNIVSNNGTTTFIGNDILQPFLLQGNQHPGSNSAPFSGGNGAGVNEEFFPGTNNSQPYTRENYSIKNLLPTGTNTVEVSIRLDATFGDIDIFGAPPSTDPFLGFVMFEIDNTDSPPGGGHYEYAAFYKYALTGATTPGAKISDYLVDATTGLTTLTLNYNKVYVFCLILDDSIGIAQGTNIGTSFTNLEFTILSKYDSGLSGVPVNAPSFPASSFMAFRGANLLEAIVPLLSTAQTDLNGFPIPVSTPNTGVSNILSNATLPPIHDLVPYDVMFTSAYSMHNLQGQSYLTISLNDFFDFWRKTCQMALAIENDISGNQTVIRMENLAYFLNNTIMLLDLGTNVYGLEITQLTDGLGCNLKAGYQKVDTNSDAGMDEYNTSTYYNTPLSTIPGTIDLEEDNILTAQYPKEKIRAQQVSQPIGGGYDPANPSTDNQTIAFVMTHDQPFSLPAIIGGQLVQPVSPDNTPFTASAYAIKRYSNAQSNDPLAMTAPYIAGLYYPDTAQNIPLTPCRNLLRNGGMLHSMLDLMPTDYLTFRNTAIMQYNNQPLAATSISSNLQVGAGATPIIEFSDIQISTLDPQLYKPIIFSITTEQPVNMYQIIGNNPNGYIQFEIVSKYGGSKIYKGFIYKVSQSIGNGVATRFDLLATPDMVI